MKKKFMPFCIALLLVCGKVVSQENDMDIQKLYSQTDIVSEINYYFNAWQALHSSPDILETSFLSEFSIGMLSNDDCRYLRNLVYSRRGYIFSSEELSDYFSKRFKWYRGTTKNVDSQLTQNEKENIRCIKAFEERNEKLAQTNYTDNMEGVWRDDYEMSNEWPNRFAFKTNGQFDYYERQNS